MPQAGVRTFKTPSWSSNSDWAYRVPILGFLDYLKWGGLEPKFFQLRGVGPSLIPYYGYANSFIDSFCSRPNSVARFRKREVNNYSKFLYFLFSLATTHDFSYLWVYTGCLLSLVVTGVA
jgi:hypothetical protein